MPSIRSMCNLYNTLQSRHDCLICRPIMIRKEYDLEMLARLDRVHGRTYRSRKYGADAKESFTYPRTTFNTSSTTSRRFLWAPGLRYQANMPHAWTSDQVPSAIWRNNYATCNPSRFSPSAPSIYSIVLHVATDCCFRKLNVDRRVGIGQPKTG